MTQEEKDLLIKDLCARLHYGVILNCCDSIGEKLTAINKDGIINHDYDIDEVRPYLFHLSSMTEEQRKEYEGIIYKNIELNWEIYYDVIAVDDFDCLIDFYHKYHFDYRGLIPMGLAIDCTNLNIY